MLNDHTASVPWKWIPPLAWGTLSRSTLSPLIYLFWACVTSCFPPYASPRDVFPAGTSSSPSLPFPSLGLPPPLFSGQPQTTCLFLALGHLSILCSSCFLCPDPTSSCGFGQLLPPTDCAISPNPLSCHLPKGSRILIVISLYNLGTCTFPRHPGCCLQTTLCPRVLSGSGCFYLSPSLSCYSTPHGTTRDKEWSQKNLPPLLLSMRPSPFWSPNIDPVPALSSLPHPWVLVTDRARDHPGKERLARSRMMGDACRGPLLRFPGR